MTGRQGGTFQNSLLERSLVKTSATEIHRAKPGFRLTLEEQERTCGWVKGKGKTNTTTIITKGDNHVY